MLLIFSSEICLSSALLSLLQVGSPAPFDSRAAQERRPEGQQAEEVRRRKWSKSLSEGKIIPIILRRWSKHVMFRVLGMSLSNRHRMQALLGWLG